MKSDLIEKIKSRGYWRINFQPLIYAQKLNSLKDCREIVEKNEVDLRGWNYPHIPRRIDEDSGLEPMENYYQGWIDWTVYKEFWRMYQSGQFLHYRALKEDWLEEDMFRSSLTEKIKPGSSLGVSNTVYQITEITEFLSRLTRSGLYEEGIQLSIGLNNTADRALWVDAPNRVPFIYPRKTGASSIEFSKQYEKSELLSKPKDIALEAIIHFFDRFDWEDMPVETIKKDQDDLLSRSL